MAKKQDGWIALERKIYNNSLFTEKPFDKAHAWIDLLLMANHTTVVKDGREFKRGHVYRSLNCFERRWGWSFRKVKAFMEYLEDEEMIKVVYSNKSGTCIHILKYENYQSKGRTTDSTTKRTTKRTTSKPTESKDSGKSCSTNCTTDFSKSAPQNNNDINNNDFLKKKEKEEFFSLSLEERVYESISGGPSDLALDVINRIESGEKIDWQQYEDEDGCMDYEMQIIRSITNELQSRI